MSITHQEPNEGRPAGRKGDDGLNYIVRGALSIADPLIIRSYSDRTCMLFSVDTLRTTSATARDIVTRREKLVYIHTKNLSSVNRPATHDGVKMILRSHRSPNSA